VLDRASTFADEEIVKMLKADFVPVAIDQWYTRRQDDDEGRFYQSIAKQGSRNDMAHTTQGLYVCDAAGTLLGFANNHRVDLSRVNKILVDGLAKYKKDTKVNPLQKNTIDLEYDRTAPEGTIVVRVNSKILGGYDKPANEHMAIFQQAIARDNLWILANEKEALVSGKFPESLAMRIARFHLIDNTRGEPLMWTNNALKSVNLEIDSDGVITGLVKIQSSNSKRGYEASLRGKLVIENKTIKQFDVVAKGLCFGNGPWTNHGPKGKFPLAVAFRLADGTDIADTVAPQGTKGWMESYLTNQ